MGIVTDGRWIDVLKAREREHQAQRDREAERRRQEHKKRLASEFSKLLEPFGVTVRAEDVSNEWTVRIDGLLFFVLHHIGSEFEVRLRKSCPICGAGFPDTELFGETLGSLLIWAEQHPAHVHALCAEHAEHEGVVQ